MSFPAIPVGAISAVTGTSGTGYLDPAALDATATGTQGSSSALGAGASSPVFGSYLTDAVENLQSVQEKSSALAIRAVTGDLDDVHDYTIAASEAAVTLELTAAVRNKAVEAFAEIMRMQA
ncbi:flagellar hook-basal body complex protein FliE [Flavimobilis soli]|uniref:Flagellar hook-basal body complex protein FliE n=1 Tax=Flavimobilis soli TaxID=442709 RepID=A0A2A9EES3_9MICO|nr:flagellar hook-basal body complex protein FliE [Flavimobilis soli]PFG37414.1 flagellar hook-basal body complex protein FliE [Flavimobilis soli]